MPDRPRGRNYALAETAVKQVAKTHHLPLFQPQSTQKLDLFLREHKPDLLLVIAFGLIFSPEQVREYFFVNLHASLLPKYRGASPIQAAILNADKQTGVTLFRISDRVDSGEMISSRSIPIDSMDTTISLGTKLQKISGDLISEQLSLPLSAWSFQPQQEDLASFSPKIRKEDGLVDLARENPESILRKIRAYTPWPGVFVFHHSRRVKLLSARIEDGVLRLEQVQMEGKVPTSYEDFVRGYGVLSSFLSEIF